MMHRSFLLLASMALLLSQCSIFALGKLFISQPHGRSVWVQGQTYDITVKNDKKDNVQSWRVNLMVLGGSCDGICLQDGVVAEISKDYTFKEPLRFTVPKNIVQHGKAFLIQFSNQGAGPVYESEKFTIEPPRSRASGASSDDGDDQGIQKRSLAAGASAGGNENSATFVLPTTALATALVLGVSGVFAFLMV